MARESEVKRNRATLANHDAPPTAHWSKVHQSRITIHKSRATSIALAPRQRCFDPAQPIIHVRKLLLKMIQPVQNRLIVP